MDFPFLRDRWRHALLEQQGDVCLVERANVDTDSVHWEVVILQHVPPRILPSGRMPAAIRYPSLGEWGTAGWTYVARREAEQKYRFLVGASAQRASGRQA